MPKDKLGLLQEAVARWESGGAEVETRELEGSTSALRELMFRIKVAGKVFYIEVILVDDAEQADIFEVGKLLEW